MLVHTVCAGYSVYNYGPWHGGILLWPKAKTPKRPGKKEVFNRVKGKFSISFQIGEVEVT